MRVLARPRRTFRSLRRHPRLYLLAAMTIFAFAAIVVPTMVELVASFGTYNPQGYDPRDFTRTAWLATQPAPSKGLLPRALISAVVVVVLAALWLAIFGSIRRNRR